VYFGPIALVDMLMQLAAEWNEFSRVAGVGDFETKAAEVWDKLLYILVKGVCTMRIAICKRVRRNLPQQ
jgi:hypothetical protein